MITKLASSFFLFFFCEPCPGLKCSAWRRKRKTSVINFIFAKDKRCVLPVMKNFGHTVLIILMEKGFVWWIWRGGDFWIQLSSLNGKILVCVAALCPPWKIALISFAESLVWHFFLELNLHSSVSWIMCSFSRGGQNGALYDIKSVLSDPSKYPPLRGRRTRNNVIIALVLRLPSTIWTTLIPIFA